MSLNMQIVGVREALAALEEVPRRVLNLHLRKSLNKAGGMLRTAASQFAAIDTGLLKKSLKVKVKIPAASFNVAHHGKPAYAVVGPGRATGRMMRQTRRGFRGHGKAQREFLSQVKLQRGLGARGRDIRRGALHVTFGKYSDATFRSPSRYAHLVEKGTRRGLKPRPFLGKAVRIVGPAAQNTVLTDMRAALLEEAAKAYAKRGVP